MKLIQFKVISTLNNTMSCGHVAPTTIIGAVQSLKSIYTTVYFKEDKHKKDQKSQTQEMTPKMYCIFLCTQPTLFGEKEHQCVLEKKRYFWTKK